jgi:Flp pilus assembly secretin CpaC
LVAVSLVAGVFYLLHSSFRHQVVTGHKIILVYSSTNFLSALPLARGPVPTVADIQTILTNPSFRQVIHALEQRTGHETLAEPEVVTSSGRGENRIYLTNLYVEINPAKLNR